MKRAFTLLIALCAPLGCGDDDGRTTDSDAGGDITDSGTPAADTGLDVDSGPGDVDSGADPDTGTAAFELTSTAFADGERIPDDHTCGGANVSPPLSWGAGPAGTMSYGIVFTDLDSGLIHSAIWDIPADVTSLPQAVENVFMPSVPAGARQTLAYDRRTRGYLGPCPGTEHTYELVLYAVSVPTLAGQDDRSTSRMIEGALQRDSLATASLRGTWGP